MAVPENCVGLTVNDTPGLFIQIYTDEDVTTALAVALREPQPRANRR